MQPFANYNKTVPFCTDNAGQGIFGDMICRNVML